MNEPRLEIVPDWRSLRRHDVVRFIHHMAKRHPELARPVVWDAFVRMAERDGIYVRTLPLSRPARLLRYGQHVCIQLDRRLNRSARTTYGMHELCHAWRDDPGRAFYNVEDEVLTSSEDFADLFAWVVTSPARVFQPGLREEDFEAIPSARVVAEEQVEGPE